MTKFRELKIVDFKYEHLKGFVGRKEDQERMIFQDPEGFRQIVNKSVAYSVFDGDKLVVCGGVMFLRSGFGEAWFLSTPLIKKYTRQVLKLSLYYLDMIIDKYDLYRVQATPRINWPSGYKFVERLGFKREGIMRKYGLNKKDCYMYGRIK